ncbi:hypothetical protein SLH46_11235 [Draconibacterium sp. IB214405]|uniref:hypothetical protein n=1 Tax=Draconibacterium sp. IB214405 TaxID=3097352 RepID=UPI002A169DDC|nr:hypothetical protein [Draconibacterium sp. IB214405]MDX8339760.1 hypothetical protein [Draconibacterium sp. IB214405]
MRSLIIKATISFYPQGETHSKRKFRTYLITDFKIREDMHNSGEIQFLNKEEVYAGEKDIEAIIKFPYGNLVSPFVEIGSKFKFGEVSSLYGEGIITEVLC